MTVRPRRLVVLDFSGTLSPGAAAFARPATLEAALRTCGLVAFGVTREVFWELVAATWPEASTSDIGYARSLADAAAGWADRQGRVADRSALLAAAEAFTAAYLAASTIAPGWAPWLRELVARSTVLVASDHYAEATPHLLAELARLGLRAAPVAHPEPGAVLVATSADLGSHKQTAAFWEQVRAAVGGPLDAVAVIDDFGAAEHADDRYGAAATVARRRLATTQVLRDVLDAPVDVFELRPGDRDVQALVDEAGRWATAWCDRARPAVSALPHPLVRRRRGRRR